MLFELMLTLAAVPQGDYDRARTILEEVVEPAAGKVDRLEREMDTIAARVTALEARKAAKEEEMERLEQVRVETALALRRHFQGQDLESRLEEQEQDFRQRRVVLESEVQALERDLQHARERQARVLADLKVARIEAAVVRRPEAEEVSATPLSDELWDAARPLAMERARRIGGFHWRPVPRAWMGEVEGKAGPRSRRSRATR